MSEETIMKSRLGFMKKKNDLFGEILKCDWAPDKSYDIKGQIVKYVSLSKIKRNIAPLLLKSGLAWDVEFDSPVVLNGDNICVTAKITLTDIDTAVEKSYSCTGMSAKGEKAVQIAQSFAVKSFLTNEFMIIDGADPDREDNAQQKSRYSVRSMTEVDDVKSRIQENAMQVDAPKNEPAKAEPAPEGGYKLSIMESKSIDNIRKKWNDRLAKGDVTQDQIDAMEKDLGAAMVSKDKVLEFIHKYKVI